MQFGIGGGAVSQTAPLPWNSRGCRDRGSSDIMQLMRTRMSRVAAMIVLLTCVVCPVTEMFDHWDHTLQTGQDTEYTLVLLALCVGMVYTLTLLIATPRPPLSFLTLTPNPSP